MDVAILLIDKFDTYCVTVIMISLNKPNVDFINCITGRRKNTVLWTTFCRVFRSLYERSGLNFYKRQTALYTEPNVTCMLHCA